MAFRAGLLFIALVVGSHALPLDDAEDMSIFFDHTNAESRIVGGVAAGHTPYMVALTQGTFIRSFSCGGSLISQRHVLTAAHCITGMSLSTGRITVGTDRWNSGGVLHTLSARVWHANYNGATIKNDIGILVTSTNVALNANVQLVRVSTRWAGGGVPTRATGWGRIRAGGALSATLLQLTKVTIDGQRCVTEVPRRAAELNIRNVPHVDPAVEICTFHSDGHGMCNGDSGSPLMRTDDEEQIGIVSWGLPCARAAPDMFVRVSAFTNWIAENTRL